MQETSKPANTQPFKETTLIEQETSAAQGLRITNGRARYDSSCKRLLSEKPILARIMKAAMQEYQDCDVDDIAYKYIEGAPEISTVPVHPDEKTSRITGEDTEDKTVYEGEIKYDIRFRALIPGSAEKISLLINVEAQNKFNPGYSLTTRGVYYGCRMISSQYGTEFFKSNYQDIKKVCSIWICLNPPQERRNTMTQYYLAERPLIGDVKESLENYDLMSIFFLCLGDPDKADCSSVLRMLDVMFAAPEKIELEEKKRILETDFGIAMTKTLEKEMSEMCNLSQGVWDKCHNETLAKVVYNLVKNMQWSIEQAMDVAGIEPADREICRELLKGRLS